MGTCQCQSLSVSSQLCVRPQVVKHSLNVCLVIGTVCRATAWRLARCRSWRWQSESARTSKWRFPPSATTSTNCKLSVRFLLDSRFCCVQVLDVKLGIDRAVVECLDRL